MATVRSRGVFVAEGYGENPWDLHPSLDRRIRHLYADSKKCIWTELTDEFVTGIPQGVLLGVAIGRPPRLHTAPADR